MLRKDREEEESDKPRDTAHHTDSKGGRGRDDEAPNERAVGDEERAKAYDEARSRRVCPLLKIGIALLPALPRHGSAAVGAPSAAAAAAAGERGGREREIEIGVASFPSSSLPFPPPTQRKNPNSLPRSLHPESPVPPPPSASAATAAAAAAPRQRALL
ncbi:hypothetical protein ACMD2_19547 [Ananas comosus]|uniref:Uncharacterized protein n=1 Tax=Ananas comosus TaxID=4615 RepID=A0A199UFJ7_ANACO|nr:hypothetical protein ACMD2_19547 [Ananas comosus]